jgi:hypothetical protein
LNWSLLEHPQLYQPETLPAQPGLATPWLRLEWQTLRRLPQTGAIVFAIRTHQLPWLETPAATRRFLLEHIQQMPAAWRAYKGLDAWVARLKA